MLESGSEAHHRDCVTLRSISSRAFLDAKWCYSALRPARAHGMNQLERFRATISTYRSHGWRLQSVLMRFATQAELRHAESKPDALSVELLFEGVPVRVDEFDAAWFARESGAVNRTACELRLIGDVPYSLFEMFEPDEAEEDRADVRREMEARLRDYAGGRREPLEE